MSSLTPPDPGIAEVEGTPTTIINLNHKDDLPPLQLTDSRNQDSDKTTPFYTDQNKASLPVLNISTDKQKTPQHEGNKGEEEVEEVDIPEEPKEPTMTVSAIASGSSSSSYSSQPAPASGSALQQAQQAALTAKPTSPITQFTKGSNKERLIMVWRLVDNNIFYIRPIVLPLLAFMVGRFGLNPLFAILLALVWFYALRNGHLFPRPPVDPAAAASASKLAQMFSPASTPNPNSADTDSHDAKLNADLSLAAFQAEAARSAEAVGMLNLPQLLTGLTVQYPDWVFFPDVQRTKWINDILAILWPYAKAAVKADIDKQIAPFLAMAKGYVKLAEMDFGPDPPFVGGIKVYDTKAEQVMMDIDIRLAIEPKVRVEARWKWLCLGVSVTAVTGVFTARVVLSDMCGKFPCFRRLGISLANKPQLQTTVMIFGINLFDIPILGSFGQHFIEDMTVTLFGWPKELSIPIMVETAEEIAARNKLEPKGLLHVYLMSANNLRNADSILGKSDPYCKLSVGDQTMTSEVINNNLNPIWNADFEFIVYEPERETLSISVYDMDVVKVPNPLQSKRLGDVEFAISELLTQPFQDVSLPLQHTTKGNIRFQCEWRPFALHRSHHHSANASGSHTASNSVLFVSNLRAYDLPVDNCYLKLTCGSTKKKTCLAHERGRELEWEERFSFPVYNAEVETLNIQFRYDDHLGKLTGFATKNLTLGMKQMKTKSSILGEITIDVREVARTGHLSDDFVIPLPPGMKFQGRPKLHVNLLLRELAASVSAKQRLVAAGRAAVPGTLTFTLISASNLIGVEHHGTQSDPFCTITVGAQQYKSKVQRKTINPEWNETHVFKITDVLRDEVHMDFRDWGRLGSVPLMGGMMDSFKNKVTMKSDMLGDCHVPLRLLYPQLYKKEPVVKDLPLNHTKQGTCKIKIQFEGEPGHELPPPDESMAGSQLDLKRLNTTLGAPNGKSASPSSAARELSDMKAVSEEGSEETIGTHVTKGGQKTDTAAVAPMMKPRLNAASVGVAAGMKQAHELQRNGHNVNAAPSSASSLPGSASNSPPGTPSHPMHYSYSSTPPDTGTPPDQQSHERHASLSAFNHFATEMDYIHHDARSLVGWLVLTIHRAVNLPAQFKDHTIAAYVKVTLGRNKVHTKVIRDANPLWEEHFRLPLHAQELLTPSQTMMKIRVKQSTKKLFGANDTVGDADVALSQLLTGGATVKNPENPQQTIVEINIQQQEFTLMVPKSNTVAGGVIISCTFEAAAHNHF